MKKNTLFFAALLIYSIVNAATDKYRLVYRTDPATSIVVGWNQISGTNPIVYYDVVDHGTNWSAYTFQKTVDRTENYKSMNHNFARLTGLQPNTNYYFVIKDSEGTSSRFWFKTLPDNSNIPLSVIAGGDSRTNPTARQNANKLVSKIRPHFIMFGGDMTDLNLDNEWQEWFEDWQLTTSADGRMYPIIPTRGNHEWSNDDIYKMFDVIDANAQYALTVGGDMARIYTLNTESAISGAQTSWLVNDLQTNYQNTIWRLAQYHKPMRPHVSSKSEGNDQYLNWAQPFFDYKMNVVVECDAHTVKTTWPVKPSSVGGSDEGFVKDSINGTVYIGEGCWGAPLRTNDDDKDWTRNSAKFNSFHWIHLSKERIEIRTIGTDNVASVGAVSDTNPFALPSNIDVWNPSNGDVVIIENPAFLGLPNVNVIYPTNNTYYASSQNITIEANATDANGTIDYVQFYINGVLFDTDYNTPWQTSYTVPNNAITTIKAVAYDDDGYYDLDEINIYSGIITISNQVAESNDDAEEDKSDGSMDIASSDLEISVEDNIWPVSDANQWIGIRFQQVNIPQGAIIDNAYIQFTVDESTTSSAISIVYGEKNFNATPFYNLPNNISARTKTTNSVTWNIAAWNTVGQAGVNQQTSNLNAIVQEIVNQPNWNSNNAMAFLIEGSGTRTAEAYDGESNKAPTLHITYHLDEPTSVNSSKKNQGFRFFPNPTSKNIKIDLTHFTEIPTVEIYSLTGKKVLEKRLVAGKMNSLNLDLAVGVYIINLNAGKKNFSEKLIIR